MAGGRAAGNFERGKYPSVQAGDRIWQTWQGYGMRGSLRDLIEKMNRELEERERVRSDRHGAPARKSETWAFG
jgi:hypothetical protein